MYALSIGIIVVSNIVYNICQKSTPGTANPFVSLLVTYSTAMALTAGLLLFDRPERGLGYSLRQLNWSSIVLGLAIVGLEFGYLVAYRVGWNISVASLVANIILALALIVVGVVGYGEKFEPKKAIGALACLVGLVLLSV